MSNVARLVLDACERHPDAPFGTVQDRRTLDAAVGVAAGLADVLADSGVEAGARVAVVGHTSTSYLMAWMALQLVGAEAALVNPKYTDGMIDSMVDALDPAALVLVDRDRAHVASVPVIDASRVASGGVVVDGVVSSIPNAEVRRSPGLDRDPLAIAGYMHTSGTTGPPKFCAQSHEYFLRLGAVIAASLGLTTDDLVFAPLPMFHVNPLGYGVVGALHAAAGVLGAERFSASSFWNDVVEHEVTALVMHAPPVEILKRATTDPAAHRVRTMFYADAEFMTRFHVDSAVTAYGSTEAGGVSHTHVWTADAARSVSQSDDGSIARFGGSPRADIEARLEDDGTILVRERAPGALFSGYLDRGVVVSPTDPDGWFDTGDIGCLDQQGNLRFIERKAESIRVKGEYVPIPMVEAALADLEGVDDLALWKRRGTLDDDEVVLYTAPRLPDLGELAERIRDLPGFMRPAAVFAIPRVPRDEGVGKVQRRRLAEEEPTDEVEL